MGLHHPGCNGSGVVEDSASEFMHIKSTHACRRAYTDICSYFAPAPYQAAAVNKFLTQHPPRVPSYDVNENATNLGENGGVYNRLGRGYPDVSVNGNFYLHYINQTATHSYGTSLSTPVL
jgi:hypothetical protein